MDFEEPWSRWHKFAETPRRKKMPSAIRKILDNSLRKIRTLFLEDEDDICVLFSKSSRGFFGCLALTETRLIFHGGGYFGTPNEQLIEMPLNSITKVEVKELEMDDTRPSKLLLYIWEGSKLTAFSYPMEDSEELEDFVFNLRLEMD